MSIKLRDYNDVVREIAVVATWRLGADSPESRRQQARWMRRVRREYPYSSQRRESNVHKG